MWWTLRSVSMLLLTLLVWPPAEPREPARRWLADPELLAINSEGQQSPNGITDMALVNRSTGWAITFKDILRFDGRYLHNDQTRSTPDVLVAISMTGPTSGWIVGTSKFDPYGRDPHPANVSMLRYAGNNTWQDLSQVVHKDGSTGSLPGELSGVAALTDGTAWAVGKWREEQNEHPLLLHFDGLAWHDVTPDGWHDGSLTSISMVSAVDGWVGGVLGRWQASGGDARRPLLAHWKNGNWSEEPFPPSARFPNVTVDQIIMADATEGWAVYRKDGASCAQTGLLHYLQGAWAEVANIGQFQEYIAGFGLIPGTSRGWLSLRPACAAITPGRRMRFDNGIVTADTTSATLVPAVYALLDDDVQWAAAGGALMRLTDEPLPTERQPAGAATGQFFAATGQYVSGAFLDYYTTHGLDLGDPGISERESLALFGYPISTPYQEVNPETGVIILVQYFERARMEYHPENADPYKVLLGRLGYQLSNGHTLGQTGCEAFRKTGYELCPPFRSFWHKNSGLPVFGFPVADAEQETSQTDGKDYISQRFERERLEYHPEHKDTPYEIQLGLLGTENLRARGYMGN